MSVREREAEQLINLPTLWKLKLMTTSKIIKYLEFSVPLIVVLIGTYLCRTTDLDMAISRNYFDFDNGTWPAHDNPVIYFSYVWGPAVSALLGLYALFRLFFSYMHPRFLVNRAVSLYIILSLVVGPILITNGLVKETWRRPRPRETVEFGGSFQYQKVLDIGNRDFHGKSFPGGHASSGFILVLLYFLFKRKSRLISALGLLTGLILGTWIGFVRTALGGHFFSDNLYAFGINWYVPLLLYYFWYLRYEKKRTQIIPFHPSRKRYFIGGSLLATGVLLLSFRFLFSAPFSIDYPENISHLPTSQKELSIKIRAKKGDINVRKGKPGQVRLYTWISGHAFPGIKADRTFNLEETDRKWHLSYLVKPDGLHYEYQSHTEVYVPENVKIKWDLFTEQGAIRRGDLQD